MSRVINAIQFATAAHENQKRKGKEVSYIMHPLSVGLLLASSGAKEERDSLSEAFADDAVVIVSV